MSTATDATRSPHEAGSLLERLAAMLAGRSDVLLALLIVAVIALFVLPLPTFLLDILIATNLAASIALLMLSVYVPSALGLLTFPSLLLLTTLFRLSLNIASTKLILLDGDAGHIIETFGRMVVGGNVVVGLVVFLIIALVQFIVIAKGAERVAEVGARFSLDGMPGKQMSIDADLRAGTITKEEAQRRRALLEEESHLHGAMDGAMKFVKGDAIAGIVIAAVNIIGGIAIGMTMRSLAFGEALTTYVILSIGDGMVAQLPSLFVSIAAGIVITRVAGGAEGTSRHLGAQIAREVLRHPTALLMAGAIVATFLLVPSLPFWPFLCLGALLTGTGYLALRRQAQSKAIDRTVMDPASAGGALADGATESPPIAVPLRARLAPDLRQSLSPQAFDAALRAEQSRLVQQLGLPFPRLNVSFDATLGAGRYAIDVQEVEVAQGDLKDTNLAAELAQAVRNHAGAFIGIQEVQDLLTRASSQLPHLTAEVLRVVPLQRVAEVLRRLAEEQVSIRHLREICESLQQWGPREKDTAMLAEHVRVDLGKFTVRQWLDDKGQLRGFVLAPDVEKVLRDSVQQSVGGSFLAVPPDTSRELMARAELLFASTARSGEPLILLASMEVRRYAKKFLATRFPSLVALSWQELPADVQVQSAGLLTMAAGAQRRTA
jgi:type III secretion protein V